MAAPDEALAFKVNPKVVATSDPPIPLAAAWASLYASSADNPLVNLAQGVPGAPPPDEFLQRLGDAASQPSSTTYGDLRGDEGLRKAFVADVNQVYGGDVGVDEVVLTAGCNLVRPTITLGEFWTDPRRPQAFYSAMVSLASAGDEVILPAPWYFNAQWVAS
jgi:aspartate/methionine/tyrosine aminotransferase